MSGIPLTEERFLEIFTKLIQPIKDDISELKIDVSQLKKDMIEVKGFITYESQAIEHEIQRVLENYLHKQYPLLKIKDISHRDMIDIYGKIITELDAAFILEPDIPSIGSDIRQQLQNFKIKIPKKNMLFKDSIFILAEAKHHITPEKIGIKLVQFDKICDFFKLAKKIMDSIERGIDITNKYSKLIISTVKRELFFSEVVEWKLFFGALHWDITLLKKLQKDVYEYKNLCNKFKEASNELKISIYNTIQKIEDRWYPKDRVKIALTKEEIIILNYIGNALLYVDFIIPSGDRYYISKENEPSGISSFILEGGNKKKKTKKLNR